jgi:glyoxylase-like metal-dependent hydrolase (beta-lactamase superfamily II)
LLTRVVTLRPDLIGIHDWFVWCYLLLDDDEVTLLDTGFAGSARAIRRWFHQTGRAPSALKRIILTHGHYDHAGRAAELAEWSGAPIWLHPADLAIARGSFRYSGAARWCGRLERIGRTVFRSRPPGPTNPLADGMTFPWWGGLTVRHLPGHTPGHCGLWAPAKRVLFPADSFLVNGDRILMPAGIFNVDKVEQRRSLLKLADVDVDAVFPMHHRRLPDDLMTPLRAKIADVRRALSDAGLLTDGSSNPSP